MSKEIIKIKNIRSLILIMRGKQVILDSDLAQLYGVETKNLNLTVKRNIERFPDSFRFQLTEHEYKSLRLQIETSNTKRGGRRYLPYAFTEQGVAMLSAVLRSKTAVKISIQIMQAFVEMKKFITANAGIFQRIDKIEQKQIIADKKFDKIFKALEDKNLPPNQGIFFNGQVFDAYTFVSGLIRKAQKKIILIDNYIDDTVLTLFTKRKKNVVLTIYTNKISKQLLLDIKKLNEQYLPVEIKTFKQAHDRFLIIDNTELYHFGASLKDLGKKWFAFSQMNSLIQDVLIKL